MYAKFIITDFPSYDSVHGIVTFYNDKKPEVMVSSSLVPSVGKLAIEDAVSGRENNLCRLSEERLTHPSDLKKVVLKMAKTYKFQKFYMEEL